MSQGQKIGPASYTLSLRQAQERCSMLWRGLDRPFRGEYGKKMLEGQMLLDDRRQ
jgi:hypothetical protein